MIGEELYRRDRCEEAARSFNRLALQPNHFWAQFFLAVCHLKAQRRESAKAGLNACLSQQPDFVWGYLFAASPTKSSTSWRTPKRIFKKRYNTIWMKALATFF